MDELEDLRADHSTLATILRARRAVYMDDKSIGIRTLWSIYLFILEDALKALDALIDFLNTR
jgi:hypothetical protein